MNMKYWGHCLLFMLGLASVCSCTDSEKIVHYRGIAVDDANGSEGLYNPERGFRLETAVDLVTQKEPSVRTKLENGYFVVEVCFG